MYVGGHNKLVHPTDRDLSGKKNLEQYVQLGILLAEDTTTYITTTKQSCAYEISICAVIEMPRISAPHAILVIITGVAFSPSTRSTGTKPLTAAHPLFSLPEISSPNPGPSSQSHIPSPKSQVPAHVHTVQEVSNHVNVNANTHAVSQSAWNTELLQ